MSSVTGTVQTSNGLGSGGVSVNRASKSLGLRLPGEESVGWPGHLVGKENEGRLVATRTGGLVRASARLS